MGMGSLLLLCSLRDSVWNFGPLRLCADLRICYLLTYCLCINTLVSSFLLNFSPLSVFVLVFFLGLNIIKGFIGIVWKESLYLQSYRHVVLNCQRSALSICGKPAYLRFAYRWCCGCFKRENKLTYNLVMWLLHERLLVELICYKLWMFNIQRKCYKI